MAQQFLNLGTDANDGTGTTLRAGGLKVAIAIAFATNRLVHYDQPIFNLDNGAAFAMVGYRPVDNSSALALLKRGAVAVS